LSVVERRTKKPSF